jgi:Kef-type K+ transport system membrane component KefB
MLIPLLAESAALDITALAKEIRRLHVESVLLPILIQLGIILIAARVMALIAKKLGQPSAVGEIIAGLLLGPSFLERVWPVGYAWLFHPHIHDARPEFQPLFEVTLHWVFTILSQIGLILLLFLIGLEFDFSHLKSKGRAAAAISLSGIILPFFLGWSLAYAIYPYVTVGLEQPLPFVGFSLFMGTAMSITALPILGRIMMELNITQTRLGAITISAAAVDDVMGWIILAAVAAVVRGQFTVNSVFIMILATAGFGVFMLFLAGPTLRRWAASCIANPTKQISPLSFAILLTLIFATSIVTNYIGIFAIFGAFLIGATLSPERKFAAAVGTKLHDFVMVFFLPIFFTYTGLRTRIDTVDTPLLWGICGLVLGAAVLGKFGGCGLAAKLSGFNTRESICIGTMMNTRALMELVVINIGKDLGVIPDSVFCMLVLMALITTIMTCPLLLYFQRGTEIEPFVAQSEFGLSPNPLKPE